MDESTRIRSLLDKYLSNTCTKSEMQELLFLMRRAEHEPRIKHLLSEYWAELPLEADPSQRSREVKGWFDEIYAQALLREDAPRGGNRRKSLPMTASWIKIAAILMVSFGLSYMYQILQKDVVIDDIVVYERKVAGPGEKIRFVLPDGTQVHLNAGSELTYSSEFNEHAREMELSGEAYFVVAKDEERPFVVHAGGLATKVLGTSFNLRAYPADNQVVVAVARGQVGVTDSSNQDEQVILEAGQWADYTPGTGGLRMGTGDVTEYVAWNEGILFYHDKQLDYVATQLERWYDVNITFANESLRTCVIRGEHQNEALTNVLNAIGYAFEIEYRIQGREVILMGEGCE